MAEQKRDDQERNDQDERRGGYGDDAGEADPASAGAGGGAAGRQNPVTDSADADEALGNRTGGYGGNPPSNENGTSE